jgi:hypothetical protein
MVLPEDWEMQLFSKRLEDGSCTFADRYQYRMQVAWRVLEGEPDVERTMRDYAGKLRHEEERTDVKTQSLAGWAGVVFADEHGQAVSRFIRYFPETSILLEVIFPPADADPACKDTILKSMVSTGDLLQWRALGLDIKAPEGMRMVACEARPGAASMRFIPEKGDEKTEEFYVVRLGMLKRWLRGTPQDWLRLQLPSGASVENYGNLAESGHAGAWFEGRLPRKSWLREWLGIPGRFHAVAWVCPVDGRLYMRMRKYRAKERFAGANGIGYGLHCCASANRQIPSGALK